jgi:hypothetical protein
MDAVLELTAQLRSTCMDLALRKMDYGPEYEVLEDVLRGANKLTGQDMYGRFARAMPRAAGERKRNRLCSGSLPGAFAALKSRRRLVQE